MQSYTPQDHGSFKLNVNYDPINWLSATGMVVMATILILLNVSLISSISAFRKKKKSDHTSKLVLCSVVSTISFTITSISCFTSTVLMIISSDFNHRTVVGDACSKTSLSLYTISQTLMVYVFVRRIDEAFGGSAVQYPKILMKSLYTASIIFVIFCLFMTFALAFEFMMIFVVSLCIWMALFLCLSTILCILFVRRANVLLKGTSDYDNHNSRIVDKDLLHVVIKQSMIVPFAICSSFTCFMAVLLVQYGRSSSEWIPAAIFWIVVDCTVSSISVFLLFSWNNGIYNKYCGLIHYHFAKQKTSRMELLNIKKASKSTNDHSNVNEPTLTEPAYTMSHFTSTSNLTQTTAPESTGNLNVPQSKIDAYSGSSGDDMPTPIKPKLTVTQSLKRISGKETKNNFTLAVNLVKPKLCVVHSAPAPH